MVAIFDETARGVAASDIFVIFSAIVFIFSTIV